MFTVTVSKNPLLIYITMDFGLYSKTVIVGKHKKSKPEAPF